MTAQPSWLNHQCGQAPPRLLLGRTLAERRRGPVVCNARTCPGQLICLDVKGEACRLSADHRRRMGQDVHVLDLRDDGGAGDALNPLDLARMQGSDLGAVARALAAGQPTPAPPRRTGRNNPEPPPCACP